MKRLRIVALVGAIATLFALPTSSAHATTPPTSSVYASSSREICHLPAGGNAQHVLGFDVGFSTVYKETGQTIWFFGDTYVDGNNDGVFNGGFEFRTGTIARSNDKNPNNCFNLKWKKNEQGKVANMLQPQGDECLTWPDGAIDLQGTMYVFYTAVHKPKCGDNPDNLDGPTTFTQGLLKITNMTTLATERVAEMWTKADPYEFGMPYQIGNYIYLFGEEAPPNSFGVTYSHLARVPADAASLADKSAYQFLGHSGWTTDAAASKRLLYQATAGGPVTLAYNKYLGRYLAVFGCNYTQVCAATSSSSSAAEAGLTADWNGPITLVDCGGEIWSCYQGAQHPEFNSVDDRTLIITAARHDDPHYWVTVRQVQLSTTPLVFSRELVDGQRDFYAPHSHDDQQRTTSEQGTNNWTYVSWPSKTPLTWENIIRPDPTPDDPNRQVTCSRAWVGTETTPYPKPPAAVCADVPLRVPRVFPIGAEPGVTQDVAVDLDGALAGNRLDRRHGLGRAHVRRRHDARSAPTERHDVDITVSQTVEADVDEEARGPRQHPARARRGRRSVGVPHRPRHADRLLRPHVFQPDDGVRPGVVAPRRDLRLPRQPCAELPRLDVRDLPARRRRHRRLREHERVRHQHGHVVEHHELPDRTGRRFADVARERKPADDRGHGDQPYLDGARDGQGARQRPHPRPGPPVVVRARRRSSRCRVPRRHTRLARGAGLEDRHRRRRAARRVRRQRQHRDQLRFVVDGGAVPGCDNTPFAPTLDFTWN